NLSMGPAIMAKAEVATIKVVTKRASKAPIQRIILQVVKRLDITFAITLATTRQIRSD
ncbi:MAG: hypothetical protein MMC33_006028, partial [Icmadophila ericetorum]|nr:hypothetical protein [Icmadophila ericetorum]